MWEKIEGRKEKKYRKLEGIVDEWFSIETRYIADWSFLGMCYYDASSSKNTARLVTRPVRLVSCDVSCLVWFVSGW